MSRGRLLGGVVAVLSAAALAVGGPVLAASAAPSVGGSAAYSVAYSVAPSVARKAAAPVLSPARAIPGERVTATGRLPEAGKRVVRVEQRRAGSWVRVAKTTTAKSGAFTARFRAAEAGSVRVRAPKVRKLKAVVSKTTRLRIVPQAGSLDGLDWVYRWKPVSYAASFSPARPGRVVSLQRFAGGAWQVVASGVQDAAGAASFSVTPATLGSFKYRARTSQANGAPAFATAETPLVVRSEFGWTTRVSSVCDDGEDGARSASVSGDGRYVAFQCAPAGGGPAQVFLWDRQSGTTTVVSAGLDGVPGNDDSQNPAVSADGRYVAFESRATDLVADGRSAGSDVLVWTRESAVLERISRGPGGVRANGGSFVPSISGDGARVAFQSDASNLGPRDLNEASDVYVWERGGSTRLASSSKTDDDGMGIAATNPALSADGGHVVYASRFSEEGSAPGQVEVLLRDLDVADPVLVRAGIGAPTDASVVRPFVSLDGRYVVFDWPAPGDPRGRDVFLWDRDAGEIVRVSNGSGVEGSRAASISADGRYVAYQSDAPDLVAADALPVDTNDADDIFVWDRIERVTRRASVSTRGVEADGASYDPVISTDGRYVAYHSDASNLDDGPVDAAAGPGASAIYLWDRDN